MIFAACGCSTLLAVRDQQKRASQNAVLSGTIATNHKNTGPLVVGLIAQGKDGEYLLDYFVAEKPGPWIFVVAPGSYRIAAFEDANSDGNYSDEPALPRNAQPSVDVVAGQRLEGIALTIPMAGRFSRSVFTLGELAPRSAEDQQRVSLFSRSIAGEVASLTDARFNEAVAQEGMWKYYDFILHTQPGIYFLEPYDPARIPVLFVHGIGGTPQNFAPLIQALDHRRFQAWVYYYPSGATLDTSAGLLEQLFVRLRHQYHFKEAVVVAHSMGGLVSREFLLDDFEQNSTGVVRAFVSISSPFGGMESAGKGVERSPVIIRSWYGLAPGSAYLDGLFYRDPSTRKQRRRLPDRIVYHMMFGFKGGASGDGIVTIKSQLRPEAQEEALSLRGFDETHAGILESPATAARLNEILSTVR